jgi:membrane protease YdiL (CAAX protease family)
LILGLWLLAVAAFVIVAAGKTAGAGHIVASGIAFALLMGLYLLFSQPGASEAIGQIARNGGEYGLPGFLWIVFVVLALVAGSPNVGVDSALAGAAIWLPTALVVNNRPALTPIHALVGLSALVMPLGIDVVLGARPASTEAVLRVGAFALPVLLIALTTREQKSRLSFQFIAAVAFLWFSVEFGNLPDLSLPFQAGLIGYLHLAAIVLFLYLLTLAGRLPDLGFTFSLGRKDWREVAFNFAAFAAIALPAGLLTGFIRPSSALPSIVDSAARGLAIFFFIALPEEILFRGTIHRYLERVLRWTPRLTLLLSSIIFGASHLNNPPNVGWYFLLASAAGWFYGRAYLRTGKIVPAAIVHLMVDWVWSVFFAG